ncbi:MAG: hypothetical protein EPN93_07135 [Spirochaetes bacterium]|nr:MAG: hypothetical protein EPN93_07135 [Spirochaetota bacterium]
MNAAHAQLERIFNPRSLAVVGVSAQGFGFGRGILHALHAIGFEGALHAVNPKGGEMLGFPIHKSIADIPGPLDFAIIALPANLVPEALGQCLEKGAAGAEILSAGFRELGTDEGAALEEAVRAVAARGLRVIGPNCFGVYAPKSGLTMLPGPDLSREPGPVAFISQSGGMAIDLCHAGRWKGIRFSKVVSFGNGADLRETELLDYLRTDDETGVIGVYAEGVGDGRKFIETLRRTAAVKPVVLYKGGLSEAGGRAVASHTASMGGSGVIWESALRQCNACQVQSLEELADTCLAFSLLPARPLRGLAIVGGGGALGVAAADAAESYGLVMPPFDAALQEKILPLLPRPGSSAGNPVDVANPFVPPDAIQGILSHAGSDPRVDILILVQLLYHFKSLVPMMGAQSLMDIVPVEQFANAAAAAAACTGKPVVAVLPNHKREPESMDIENVMRAARAAYLARGIPVYDDLISAMKAIGHVTRYYSRKEAR